MPIFESRCTQCGHISEHYYHCSTAVTGPCDICHGPTRKMISRFNHGLMGTIERRHLDLSIEGSERLKDGGHWVVEKNTPDGKPRHRFISTFQEQREHCKQEGLANPSDIPAAFSVKEDGKTPTSTQGLPGCWV